MENLTLRGKNGKIQFVKGSDIVWSRRKHIQRAGVILYFTENSKVYFIMGLDRKFKEWTDFGGSVNEKEKEQGQHTALRELKEETLGVFDGYIDKERIKDPKTVAVIEKAMVILFIELPIGMSEFLEKKALYDKRVLEKKGIVENIAIDVFTQEEFMATIKGEKKDEKAMYELVSNHLKRKITDLNYWFSYSTGK